MKKKTLKVEIMYLVKDKSSQDTCTPLLHGQAKFVAKNVFRRRKTFLDEKNLHVSV